MTTTASAAATAESSTRTVPGTTWRTLAVLVTVVVATAIGSWVDSLLIVDSSTGQLAHVPSTAAALFTGAYGV